jgi:hypothetical protein
MPVADLSTVDKSRTFTRALPDIKTDSNVAAVEPPRSCRRRRDLEGLFIRLGFAIDAIGAKRDDLMTASRAPDLL